MSEMTVGNLVEQARRWLIGAHGQPQNKLNLDIDAEATEIKVDYALGVLSAQRFIAIEDEILYVWEIQTGNQEATVSRGQLGTTAVAHEAGAAVESMSRFPRPFIKSALVDEVNSWPDGLYQVRSRDLEVGRDAGVVDLGLRDHAFSWVISVTRAPRESSAWRNADRWAPLQFTVHRKMPRTDFSSGTALTLHQKLTESSRIRVLYAAPFTTENTDDSIDVVEDWGLEPTMLDIVPIGAAARLLHAREIQRTDTEALGETRVAAEVPPTHHTQTGTALRRFADKRISDEMVRLRGRYGTPS